tara:strand:+ start:936 stop:1205 length:270 start_codon:yes stop_codon:yes gene_type:complete
MPLTSEKRKSIFKQFGENTNDSGSVYSQVSLFTERIKHLTTHLKNNKKDFTTQRSLQLIVGKRRKLLDYLKKKNILKYREIVKALKLRK